MKPSRTPILAGIAYYALVFALGFMLGLAAQITFALMPLVQLRQRKKS
jgi:hypothetical protein